MNYHTIINNHIERAQITYPYVWWDDLFTQEEVDKMNTFFTTLGADEDGKVQAKGKVKKQSRISKVKFHVPDSANQWIFDRFNLGIKGINDQFYGFELDGYSAIQYAEYHADQQGKYDWHMDLSVGAKPTDYFLTRKLSLTFLLNQPDVDFKGGEFEISGGNTESPDVPECRRGRIIAFPSFMQHRVKPVTKGIRKSLVIWVEGPKFR